MGDPPSLGNRTFRCCFNRQLIQGTALSNSSGKAAVARLFGQFANLSEVGQVESHGDQAAAVHQDPNAHEHQCTARLADETEKLLADLLAEPECTKRQGDGRGEVDEGDQDIMLSQRRNF